MTSPVAGDHIVEEFGIYAGQRLFGEVVPVGAVKFDHAIGKVNLACVGCLVVGEGFRGIGQLRDPRRHGELQSCADTPG